MQEKTYVIPSKNWIKNIENYHELMSLAGLTEVDSEDADILVLPGGADIGKDFIRDKIEFEYYEKWKTKEKAVIGICRGLQLVLTANGGKIIQHIPEYSTKYIHTTTTINSVNESAWHTTNLGLLTNTRHHQGFISVPANWEVLDYTDDGIIESAIFKNQFLVQWHPERKEMLNTEAQMWWLQKLKQLLL
jgi:putative glutamine amidotransferase